MFGFNPNDDAPGALAKAFLHTGEKVNGVVFLNRLVGVARHTKGVACANRDPRKQEIKVLSNERLQPHE